MRLNGSRGAERSTFSRRRTTTSFNNLNCQQIRERKQPPPIRRVPCTVAAAKAPTCLDAAVADVLVPAAEPDVSHVIDDWADISPLVGDVRAGGACRAAGTPSNESQAAFHPPNDTWYIVLNGKQTHGKHNARTRMRAGH